MSRRQRNPVGISQFAPPERVEDLVQNLYGAFTTQEVEDFIAYCYGALESAPEHGRWLVRAAWRKSDFKEAIELTGPWKPNKPSVILPLYNRAVKYNIPATVMGFQPDELVELTEEQKMQIDDWRSTSGWVERTRPIHFKSERVWQMALKKDPDVVRDGSRGPMYQWFDYVAVVPPWERKRRA